jgi:hypothetical protein
VGLTASGKVCIPAEQALILARAVQRFERLKRAYAEKSQAYQALSFAFRQDSSALTGKDKLIDWYKITYTEEQSLRQDSNKKLAITQGKAKRRGLLLAAESIALAAMGYLVITH